MLHRLILSMLSHQGNSGYIALSTKDTGTAKWRDRLLRAKDRVGLREFFKKYDTDDFDLYFCPVLFDGNRRIKTKVRRSRLLWADLDEANPKDMDPMPTIAWQSSPGRYAALWVLDDWTTPEHCEELNRALTYHVGADKSGWDLTQVLRIPGTRNHKYPKSPKGKLLWDTGPVYTVADMEARVAEFMRGKQGKRNKGNILDAKQLIKKVKHKIPPSVYRTLVASKAEVGKRSAVLWKLEHDLFDSGLTPTQIILLIKNSVWNKFRGRRDEDERLEAEMKKILDNVVTEDEVDGHDDGPALAGFKEEKELKLVQLSTQNAEEIKWLWYPYMPRGKLTLLEGDPGLGKSWLSFKIATHISRATKMPGQTKAVKGRVLLLSAEDGINDTIVPRLQTMGADMEKIFAYDEPLVFDEDGLDTIRALIQELKPILVIIDPLMAYVGGNVDINKANETRQIMKGLARIAEDHKVSFLAVRHLKKGNDKALYKGLGSIDITAAVRSAIIVGEDPNYDNGRLIFHVKSNLAPKGDTIAYSLSGNTFHWDGVATGYNVDDVLSGAKDKDAEDGDTHEMAKEMLKRELANGPIRYSIIKRRAENNSIPPTPLNRAKRDLRIVSTRIDGVKCWAFQSEL